MTNDHLIKHASDPDIYPDKRNYQITYCRLRVYITEIDDENPTCEQCKEELMKDTKDGHLAV